MNVDQHSILLSPCNGFYEEFTLDPQEAGSVLPGAMLTQKATTAVQADGITTSVLTSQVSTGSDIDAVEIFVAAENALIGKSINHKANKGEVTPVYRPVSGDRYLVRAVAGNYSSGDALYLVQTTNGIYFTKTSSSSTGSAVKAYAAESFVISATTNTTLNPPFYYDVVDDSTTERPSTVRMNGGVMNLLRVRFA